MESDLQYFPQVVILSKLYL